MNQLYTVVLLVPDYLADPYGQDIYTALVEGDNQQRAIHAAQCLASCDYGLDGNSLDFHPLLVLLGHHQPLPLD